MTIQTRLSSGWTELPVLLQSIIIGLLVALPAANVWPLLVRNLGVPLGALAESIFLLLYLWWAAGGGSPRLTRVSRAAAFRQGTLSPPQWIWGIIAAIFFAATIHASIVLLFRFVPFPT